MGTDDYCEQARSGVLLTALFGMVRMGSEERVESFNNMGTLSVLNWKIACLIVTCFDFDMKRKDYDVMGKRKSRERRRTKREAVTYPPSIDFQFKTSNAWICCDMI